MLRSVMGHLGMIQYPVSHNLRPFNSLSRDHARTGPERRLKNSRLSTPSLGITLGITPFAHCMAAWMKELSTPSLGITRGAAEGRGAAGIKLSTPSLGITRHNSNTYEFEPINYTFNSLSRDHRIAGRYKRGAQGLYFQLPLSGSRLHCLYADD